MKPTPKPADLTVRLSTKGQLVVPKEIRIRHGWSSGAELTLEDLGDRVILREARDFPETRLEDLIGCTGYRGPARTLQEMEAGIGSVLAGRERSRQSTNARMTHTPPRLAAAVLNVTPRPGASSGRIASS